MSASRPPDEPPPPDTFPTAPTLPTAPKFVTAPTSDSSSRSSTSSFSSVDDSALAPGTLLLDRYRIVALLGKGGMGEVYRADDLKLGQSVALKFLPEAFAMEPARLERFRSEVRLTRQISHPNVCRVYDIGEAHLPAASTPGAPLVTRIFLSMEYVDGEDLASLLRRIGRLPEDKAIQLARQICAGLHAAHEQGVVHRDLKPSNIMLDGRGNARVMDFGVAGFVQDLNARGDIASGTPAYMAPEQLARREVTRRSDLYSLGLVLYELFTGRSAFAPMTVEQRRTLLQSGSSHTQITSPGDLVRGLDHAVERVILHCLDTDPAMRPASALAVSAALPGGDPLAAALAAGETPSPELLALSGAEGRLSRRVAWSLVALIATVLVGVGLLNDRFGLVAHAPMPISPSSGQALARVMLADLGIDLPSGPSAYSTFGIGQDEAAARAITQAQAWGRLDEIRPKPYIAWYRFSPAPLQLLSWGQRQMSIDTPPREMPGSVLLVQSIDTSLLRFERVPPQLGFLADARERAATRAASASTAVPVAEQSSTGSPPAAPDPIAAPPPIRWERFFEKAKLDFSAFRPDTPQYVASVPSDARYAWVGPLPGLEGRTLRVEAASLEGFPVAFELIPDWRRPWRPGEGSGGSLSRVTNLILSASLVAALSAAVYFAVGNVRSGRADLRGALFFALIVGGVETLSFILPRHTLMEIFSLDFVTRPLSRGMWIGGICWIVYLGLEPHVRRRWPHFLLGWTRFVVGLSSGRWTDPLPWREVLTGLTLGCILGVCFQIVGPLDFGALAQGSFVLSQPMRQLSDPYLGVSFALGTLCVLISSNLAIPLLVALLIVGLERIVRTRFIYYPLATAFMWLLIGGQSSVPSVQILAAIFAVAWMIALVRLGLLCAAVFSLAGTITANSAPTLELQAWYAAPMLVIPGFVLLLAVVAAWLCADQARPESAAGSVRPTPVA